jgi:membrane protein required for colicin V production
MSWVDGVLLLLLAAFAANGAFLGLIRQLAALVGLLLGLTLAILFYQPLGAILARLTPRLPSEATAFVLILFGVWIAAHLTAALRPRDSDTAEDVDGLDAASGALFGLLTGILMLSILVTGLVWLSLPVARALRSAHLGGWLLDVGAWMAGILSAWLPIPWAS